MTRQECEAKLISLAEQMRAVYEEYNPKGEILSAMMSNNGFILVNDSFYNADNSVVLDVHGHVYRSIDVKKFSDGEIRHSAPTKKGMA